MWSVHEVTRLRAMPDSSGIPETSATQLRDWDGKILPKLSADYVEVEYLLSGLASSYDGPVTGPVRMVSVLSHYLDALASHGVTTPPWDEAWRAIAFGMMHGLFLWGITTKQPPDVIATLLHRLGTAVDDHDALSVWQ